jgi:microcystin-dependent protein
MFAASTPPTGYFECNGQAISRTAYATLFATIGVVFGSGDGATTFNLPDLRGQFVRGWDDSAGIDPGRVFGSNQSGSNLAHNHTLTDPGHGHGVNDPSHTHGWTGGGSLLCAFNGQPQGPNMGNNNSSGFASISAASTGISIQQNSTGITIDSQGTESRPINVALMYIIKF